MEGRIIKALSGFYYVKSEAGSVYTCRAKGRFRKEGVSPLVGDRVRLEPMDDGSGTVAEILPRKNAFDRPPVANLDQIVIIASGAIPVTDPYLIDRMSAIAVLKGCEVLLLLNKCDLDSADALYDIYRATPFKLLRVSAEDGSGIEELRSALSDKLSAFTGNSGVGKSSLLNCLKPGLAIPTGEVSAALGRGRHTTRHTELFALDAHTLIADTPGFSSFETTELNWDLKQHLPETFPEFAPYLEHCRFSGCSHTKEKGCAVLEQLAAGTIAKSRHESYVRLYEELKPLQEWQIKK